MEGYMQTARSWALSGFYPKSWHYSVGKDGHIMKNLEHQHGGYHAGVSAAQTLVRPPTWGLWKGLYINVNHYTLGVEHEGFYQNWPWPEAQIRASIGLCKYLYKLLDIPMDASRFPPHAAIDVVNRVNDFSTINNRAEYYQIMHAQYFMDLNGLEDGIPMSVTYQEIKETLAALQEQEPYLIQDKRLREVQVARNQIYHVGSQDDGDKVIAARNLLKENGFV